jgi:hypothetical protein
MNTAAWLLIAVLHTSSTEFRFVDVLGAPSTYEECEARQNHPHIRASYNDMYPGSDLLCIQIVGNVLKRRSETND